MGCLVVLYVHIYSVVLDAVGNASKHITPSGDENSGHVFINAIYITIPIYSRMAHRGVGNRIRVLYYRRGRGLACWGKG